MRRRAFTVYVPLLRRRAVTAPFPLMRRRLLRVRAGFTLVELVVVMLIIAVATAVAVPALLPPPEADDVTDAVARIDALFRAARDSAVRGGAPLLVTIDSATGAVWVLADRHVEPEDAASPRPGALRAQGRLQRTAGDAAAGTSLELRPSVRLELNSARARFLFSPAGASFGDTLVVRSGAHARSVRLDPWSGNAVAY
jgi:prepilin-type N-terminal cleavage/methylation domain-containing protein